MRLSLALLGILVALPVTVLALSEGVQHENAAAHQGLPAGEIHAAAGAAQSMSCESSGLSLSRSFVARFAELEWWAVGFTPGTSVGVNLVDPTGRAFTGGAVQVDNLCEASGVVFTESRVPGAYTLVIAGTRMNGEAAELVASFNIVSLSRPPTAVPTPIVAAPDRPGGVRATAISHNTIKVDWTDNSNNETGFRIDSEAGQVRVARNTTTVNVGGLQPSTIYCFAVYAFNDAGENFGGTSCAVTQLRPQ